MSNLVAAAAELARRRNDGLLMFRSLPHQDDFFRDTATETLCRGGNRCLAAGTLVATPSGPVAIEDIKPGDLVYNEFGSPIRVLDTFDNGRRACVTITHRGRPAVTCSEDHRFLAKRHCRQTRLYEVRRMRQKDIAVRRVAVNCPLGPVHEPHAYAIGALLGDGCSRQGGARLQLSSGTPHVPEAVATVLDGKAKRLHPKNYTYSVGAVECAHYDEWCRGRYAHEKTVDIETVRSWNRESLLAFVAGVMDTDGSVYVNEYDNLCLSVEMQALPVVEAIQYAWLALWQIEAAIHTCDREKYVNGPTYSVRCGSNAYTKRAVRELDRFLVSEQKKWRPEYEAFDAKRSSPDWLGVQVGEDREVCDTYDIHVASPSNLYLLANGMVTHNSGKSTCAAAKLAAKARDLPIVLSTGEVIDQRLPHQKGRPLLIHIVGLQLNHIGQTMHRLLFRSGAYRIVRDEITGAWRAMRPEDAHEVVKPSFPFIPATSAPPENWDWERKSSRQFNYVKIVENGVHTADIYAFASTSDVKMGDPVDEIWIDEKIARDEHYPEWQARLSDTQGRIVWSSMPRRDCGPMLELTSRAMDQAEEVSNGERVKADVTEHVFRFSSNPFIPDEEKRKRLEGWSESERRKRDEGEYDTENAKIYPAFDKSFHCAVYADEKMDDPLAAILRERNGVPPENWTRDLVLDPGTAKPYVLFGAIPPEELWVNREPYFVVYDELYVPRLDAGSLAQAVKAKMGGFAFQRFIIDGQAARQTPMGFAGTIGQNYTKAFAANGVRCIETGSSFTPGDPNFATRSQLVDSWMSYRPCGRPQLRIVVDRCPALVWQLEHNLKQTQRTSTGEEIVLEKPAARQRDDARVSLEYWASRHPTYVAPPKVMPDQLSPAQRAQKELARYFNKRKPDDGSVILGPWTKQGAA